MDAHENILKYSQELLEEYPGKYIAIVRNKVVASSSSSMVVHKEVNNKFMKKKSLYSIYRTMRKR